jgi:hypothetical protein
VWCDSIQQVAGVVLVHKKKEDVGKLPLLKGGQYSQYQHHSLNQQKHLLATVRFDRLCSVYRWEGFSTQDRLKTSPSARASWVIS